jgi:tellurite methyltransferase
MTDYDQKYATVKAYFGSEPSALLQRFRDLIPAGGSVLDVGVGQGRNALALARLGHPVTGIDSSRVAVQTVRALAAAERLPIEVWQGNLIDYAPVAEPFAAFLALGLLQTLHRSEGASLIHRLREWTRPGGVVFLTAWHVDDPAYPDASKTWTRIGLHSYQNAAGEVRTFLGRGEILDLMLGWSVVHHWEGLGPEHRHGSGPPERHSRVEFVAVRPDDPRLLPHSS